MLGRAGTEHRANEQAGELPCGQLDENGEMASHRLFPLVPLSRLRAIPAAQLEAGMSAIDGQRALAFLASRLLDFSKSGTVRVVERSGWYAAFPEGSVELSASLDGPGLHLLPAA